MEYIKKNFEEWKTLGYCKDAVELNEKIGTEYFRTDEPHFLTGDIHAELVLVQLNPKRDEDYKPRNYVDFDDYWNWFTSFGKMNYGVDSPRTHKSVFDSKQVRFLKPFNLLPFKEGDKYHNLEVAIDKKLQLELVPFGSPNFDYKKIGAENLKPYIQRLMDILALADRKVIIFCGKVFEDLLKEQIIQKTPPLTSQLQKVDGTMTKKKFSAINIKMKIGDKEVVACIAPQFALQGCPITKYGEMISELYGKF
ncbi:hypothetical protein M2137_001377 [Parabacteroides sp. PFB2-10]|uniref:hypothetical protein n=1 Tax=Parabacteroides sp. PFB2-10 TaxID=1742405 RepID=UPI0024748D40|nr:hypothetical protein [Parabacteroides sp. PFB2-10]MDH6312606.1 hypothetical protein [Parabacteroides sp. PFB2-10]